MAVAKFSGRWAREGDIFLNAQNGQEHANGQDTWLELDDVRLFEFADDGRLASIARVATAEHRESGWLLSGVKRTYFENNSVTQTEVMEEHSTSQLDAAALGAIAGNLWRPRYRSAPDR